VRAYSLTLFYIPGSMQHDFQDSLLAHNLATPCLGCEPKARVMTMDFYVERCKKNNGRIQHFVGEDGL